MTGELFRSTSSMISRNMQVVIRIAYLLILLGIFASTIFIVLASPFFLRNLGHLRSADWNQLSQIGQTYGAASAILSVIALIAIAVSLLVQARQAKAERFRLVRERHFELLRMVLDSPEEYAEVIGTQNGPDLKKFLFATMWINYARLGFQMGVLTEEVLRKDILAGFAGAPLRLWWASARDGWLGEPRTDRRQRRFAQVVDEEYSRALAEDERRRTLSKDPRHGATTQMRRMSAEQVRRHQ